MLVYTQPALLAITYTIIAVSGIGGASMFVGALKARLEHFQQSERDSLAQAVAASTAQLAESAATLRALMDNVPGAVAQIAADQPGSPITFMGDEIEAIAGLPRDRFVGAPAAEFLRIVHAGQARWRRVCRPTRGLRRCRQGEHCC